MIVVTTPTGHIGSQVLTHLLGSGGPRDDVRVVVRRPESLPPAVRERVDVVVGTHDDPAVVDHALDGAGTLLWVVPPDPRCESLDVAYSGFSGAVAQALPASPVTHVVGVSALGRGTPVAGRAGLVTASLAMDDLLARTGVAYRALACGSFMDNVLRQLPSVRDGVYSDVLHPDRRWPLVATRDIAAEAARLLTDPSWTSGSTPLAGPEDLSPSEMAATMTDVLGRPVRYEREPFDVYAPRLSTYGMSPAFVQGMVDMMRAKDDGLDGGVDRSLDGPSTSFRTWCEEELAPAVALAAAVA